MWDAEHSADTDLNSTDEARIYKWFILDPGFLRFKLGLLEITSLELIQLRG
jgi:hypothetical protein